jgi:competence protein ComEC
LAEPLVNLAKRPLLPVLLPYVAGVLLGHALAPPLAWLFTVSFATVLLVIAVARWRPVTMGVVLVLAGWTNLVTRTAVIAPHDLRNFAGENPRYVTLRGVLLATPTETVVTLQDGAPSLRSHAVIEVQALGEKDAWQPAFGRVAVTTAQSLDTNFFGGRTVEVTGVLKPPPEPVAEGLFDYRTYLRWQGIYYLLRAEQPGDWRLPPEAGPVPTPPLSDRFIAWSQQVLALGLPAQDESLRLLWAMTLGWKTALTSEVSEPFMRSGTMHIFAISGLHIALIAGILVSLLRTIRVPRAACGLVVIPLIWFYTAATGWQSSAIRSTVMMTIVIAGWSLRRPGDLLNSLAASGCIILMWQPQQLFQASFQLSFFVVLSLALLAPTFDAARDWLLAGDPLLPPQLRPRWRQLLDQPLHFLATSLGTSLAAWFGSLPLIAYYFYLFTPGSLLANLIVVPLSSLALACNLGSLICGTWLPSFTSLFNHAGWLFMEGMVGVSRWSITLPGAVYHVPPPSLVACLIYYFFAFGLLTGWLFPPRRRRWALALAAACLALLAWHWLERRQETRITLLAGGDTAFVDQPGRAQDFLIDAGSGFNAGFVLQPFLKLQGVNRLPHLLLTHGDTRHVGGFSAIDDAFNIREIATSRVRSRSAPYRRILDQLAATPQRWRQLQRGDAWLGFQVLHPAADDHFNQADENAIVLRGEINGVRILLLSDLGKAGQRALVGRGQDVRADIVISGAPAQGEPLGEELLAAIQPALIILQEDTLPAHRRTRAQRHERLAQRGVPVVSTTDDGTATIVLRPGGWEVSTTKGKRWSGAPIK